MKRFSFTPAAMIFDLDGTLLDTEPMYTQAAQKVLDPFGHTYTLELKKRVMGGDSVRSAQLTIDEFGLPLTPRQFLDERETYLETLFPDALEIPGAGHFLRAAATHGIPLGLATSSHAYLCDLKINQRPWHEALDVIVCGDDDDLRESKPAPDIFLLCAERMGVSPNRTIAFEDSRNGIEAARAAGMTVVGLKSPYADEVDLKEADYLIRDFTELLF